MDNQTSVQEFLQKAYESLKSTDAETAVLFLEEALQLDFENPEVVFALKCVNWWLERNKNIIALKGNYERGQTAISNWKSFIVFLERIGKGYEACVYAIRQYAFSFALSHFKAFMAETAERPDYETLYYIGHCFKRLGDYDQAMKYLEEAVRQKSDDAEVLAELADLHALINNPRSAKALFREAFFINPQKIDFSKLESELILLLYQKVAELGYKTPELEEWIPVYGVLFSVLTVKRELRAIELGKLKQTIFSLENDIRDHPAEAGSLVPRLINRYFWLIDHYINAGEDRSKIDETLLKIKVMDSEIYKRYVG